MDDPGAGSGEAVAGAVGVEAPHAIPDTNGGVAAEPSAAPRDRSIAAARPRVEYLAARPLVLGAGPAGLSAAYALRKVGLSPVILERGDKVCDSWRHHYEDLAVNSTRRLSSLPGLLMDRSFGPWVARDDLVAYTERYARRITPDIRFGASIQRIERDGGGWLVTTSVGRWWSPCVVVALGLNGVPYTPTWPGRESFEGELTHVWEFRRAADYAGREVLVVGVGASGTDVAVQLVKAHASRVWLSVRTPPLIFRRHLSTAVMSQIIKEGRRPPRALVDRSGMWIHRLLWGDTSRYGLPNPTEGLATGLERRSHGSTVDRGLVSAIRNGHVNVVPALERFEGRDVVLRGGSIVRPQLVIAATGQRTDLRRLVGDTDVLQPDERPKVHGGATAPAAPGLYFIGYRLPAGQLLDMRFDAPAIARRIAKVMR